MTIVWKIAADADEHHPAIVEAARCLLQEELVAFPTETVYGLGADARSTLAVERIFRAKGRPSDNPLIVHIHARYALEELVRLEDEGRRKLAEHLAGAFWPGPLTLVLPVREGAVSPLVTAGLDTVAVRMPDHPVAAALLQAADCPVAAPSANRSGRPSPTAASHVMEDLRGRIAGIVDGGPCRVGLESTVVEVASDRLVVLRPGSITAEQLRAVCSRVELAEGLSASEAYEPAAAPKSPGMKYRHYAPKGRMIVVAGSTPSQAAEWISGQLREAADRGERTGVLARSEHAGMYQADVVQASGGPEEAAHTLYESLRRFDELEVAYILAEAWPDTGVGLALMNRLIKASGHPVKRLD